MWDAVAGYIDAVYVGEDGFDYCRLCHGNTDDWQELVGPWEVGFSSR